MNERSVSELGSRLDPNSLALYLGARGWRRDDPGIQNCDLWIAPSEVNPALVTVPRRFQWKDYGRRMGEVLISVAEFERRSLEAIAIDVSTVTYDRFRVSREHQEGSRWVGLIDGLALIARTKELVRIAANTAMSPDRAQGKRAPEVQYYMKRLQLGPAESNSFAVTILSRSEIPVPGFTRSQNLGTSVTGVLSTALPALEQAVSVIKRSRQFGVLKEVADAGISADLCLAVAALLRSSQSWASTEILIEPSPQNPQLGRAHVEFVAGDRQYLEDAAEYLKSADSEDVILIGWVIKLHRRKRGDFGRITTSVEINGEERQISIELSAENYDQALEAHRQSRRVAFSATIVRGPKRLRVISASNFRIVQ